MPKFKGVKNGTIGIGSTTGGVAIDDSPVDNGVGDGAEQFIVGSGDFDGGDNSTLEGIADGEGSTGSAPDGEKKRRGRPRGSGSKGPAPRVSARSTALGVDGTSEILLGIHFMLAKMTKVEELELDETEARKLSVAITRVSALYNYVPAEKTIAWVALVTAAGQVYGPRIAAVKMRIDMNKKPAPAKPSNVVPIQGV